MVEAISRHTHPARMRPGQRMMQGTRTPPSHSVPLPSRSGPAEPAWFPKLSQGPLSLVKITNVFAVEAGSFQGFEDSPHRPVDLHDDVAVQALPAPAPETSRETPRGTCGMECGT